MKHWWLVISVVAACGGSDDSGPTFSDEHPRIYLQAHKERLAAALAAGGPEAQRFRNIVDYWMDGNDVYGFEMWNVALIGQLTGDPRYCQRAVEEVDKQVKAAQEAVAAGDKPVVSEDSYLGVGEMIGDLALVYDWCHTEVGDRREAWLTYANQAVSNVWDFENASWGGMAAPWSGWGVDDPSNNYHYSFLRATMLLGLAAHGEIKDAADWRAQFHDVRMMEGLVPLFERDLVGGGSREGTGYGVAMNSLFHTYDLWEGSTGESLAKRTSHTRASMLAMMHQTVPTLDFVAPTGDHSRDSTAAFFDYHRRYVQELIHLFPDDPTAASAQTYLAESSVTKMENRFMFVYDFLYANTQVAAKPLTDLSTAYHAPGIGQLYARSSWTKDATWMNFIAGPYDQSHAHQDQGSLMIYKGGWLAYDANFTSHSGLRQEVEAHGLVRIVNAGGMSVGQRTGTTSPLLALHKGSKYLHAASDLTPAYKGSSAVTKVQRELVYIEPDVIVVYDRVTSAVGTQQVWQLVTPTRPALAGARSTVTASGHTLTVDRVSAAGSTTVHDLTADEDFSGGFRLETALPGGDQRILHVLSLDGAVTAITPETDGVTVTLAAGGTARVVFQRDVVGASLTLGGTTTNLGATVDALP